ncbi:hypothetical protein V8E51_015670 [Hyaloscypha variabilis]
MLSSLLRPKKARRRVVEHSPFSSPYAERRHATADFTEDDGEDENTEDEEDEQDEEEGDDEDVIEEEDGEEDTPLLPIFSAAHLDSLPVYNLTHAIRLIVLPRTETTLTWDQLRSPQVSQFLVKPMQQQIRTSHFSRATLYALMANCLQFEKESQANPGTAGNSRTRALVCELLAIKLLKEYNTRELIDALSYDFFPLQGIAPPESTMAGRNWDQRNRPRPAAARISTLEVAIRASAKRFLAHPLVVQQLEAIWAGTIVFHSAADNLHRPRPSTPQSRESTKPVETSQHLLVPGQNAGYGTASSRTAGSPSKQPQPQPTQSRRTVTLYDPRDASLFKLSRLRVPRYRQFFSTCSLAILLVLFVAVLAQRSMDITPLEIIFWLWSAGFMLDEIVGFNEQGFSLYIMSFWNIFDLGILLLLVIYYCMRLYGIFLVEIGRQPWNSMAYDVLAANAILLFPRLFSVLDHYRYFSQLLIAFRLMAIDLVAISLLVLIACSGFFVAFTLSFGENEYDAAGVAYKIFQILMGFTPAAWEAWPTYNILGKAILVLFLFICHFLVVTILITVLTNSFLAIASNAEQEHQFVFAVNTISMVKNDALFSYVAPSNIFAWVLTPLRFVLPFRLFIKVNRTVIKVTHFPLLFGIYAYERLFLARSVFAPTDLVENVGRGRSRVLSFHDMKLGLFSPSIRMRQESVAGFQKDRALEEVFRLAPRPDTIRTTRKGSDRRQTHNVVSNWMDHHSGIASPPQEQDHTIVDQLETRRQARKASMKQRGISGTRSVASDPADFMSKGGFDDTLGREDDGIGHTDADGDDELATYDDHDDDEGVTLDKRTGTSRSRISDSDEENEEESYFRTPTAVKINAPKLSSSSSSRKQHPSGSVPATKSPPHRRAHHRNQSTNTILYNPVTERQSSASPPKSRPLSMKHHSTANTGTHTPEKPSIPGHKTPKPSIYTKTQAKPRPIMPNRQQFQSVPNFDLDSQLKGTRTRQVRHRRSSLDMGMSELGLEANAPGMLGAVPSSFATQMALATGGLKGFGGRSGGGKGGDTEDNGMMGRLMLARMKTLEEGFAEVVKEFRGMGLRTAGNSSVELDESGKGKGRERDKGRRRRGLPRTKSEVNVAKVGLGLEGHDAVGNENIEVEGSRDTPEQDIIARYVVRQGSSL